MSGSPDAWMSPRRGITRGYRKLIVSPDAIDSFSIRDYNAVYRTRQVGR